MEKRTKQKKKRTSQKPKTKEREVQSHSRLTKKSIVHCKDNTFKIFFFEVVDTQHTLKQNLKDAKHKNKLQFTVNKYKINEM
ncbi:hypothetical protein RFI_14958 [Reticulomyxa filosa]|uniref:Uncharacterized protein n=1 Tax=Reticulomyxa filosa TaxID=46433 RepID=X6NAA2_RETFI|nr:hypothetical protein RFI_14958 [Reticulomyxa filosa]|eukprot:ETO22242.1 hypothetical protein RFI_14958 [Reticulomyxa filosa]